MASETGPHRFWETTRAAQQFATTAREVGRIECLPLCGAEAFEVGTVVTLGERDWLVVGIFEPAHPAEPWTVALGASTNETFVLRNPSVTVPQDEVLRVLDGLDFAG